jgi:hypothetical protein
VDQTARLSRSDQYPLQGVFAVRYSSGNVVVLCRSHRFRTRKFNIGVVAA